MPFPVCNLIPRFCEFNSFVVVDIDSRNYNELKPFSTRKSDISSGEAAFEKPARIGTYSLAISKTTGERRVLLDESKLSYLRLPAKNESVNFDLTDGYQQHKHIDWAAPGNCKLDELLQWLVNSEFKFSDNETQPVGADFVTYRGVLTKLLVTPFVNDRWTLGACKHKGTIYLCPFYETSPLEEQNNLFSFGGHRFENYITRSQPGQLQCDPFSSEKGEYSVVMRSRLKSHSGRMSLMYAAEVDCLDEGQLDTSSMENFVEIKTTRTIHHPNQQRNFQRFKLIKWWAQSYLIGIPKIICGYKDNRHLIDDIEQMNVHRIPALCAPHWTRSECFNFLQDFLRHIQSIVRDDDSNQVYLFANNQPNTITCKRLLNAAQFQILPQWYIEKLQLKISNKPLLYKQEDNVEDEK